MAASSQYKLIIGLGNPGEDYKDTYHNVGLLFLDHFFDDAKFKVYKNFMYAKVGNAVVVKPLTFMNDSGKAVSLAIKHFKTNTKELLIIHDDSDIELGKYKVSVGRGGAGHKGVESIIKAVGTNEFTRLRIGVRRENKNRRMKAGNFVLRKICKGDLISLKKTFKNISKESGLALERNGKPY